MRDLARMAIAAFGRREEGSGVIGVDVQRIRRALGLRTEPQPDLPAEDPRREGLPRDALRRFEALLRRELERGQIERTGSLPPSRPLGELDRALPSGPLADLAAVHRVVIQLRRRLATQGMQARGHRRHAQVDVRRTMRASLQTGGVPVVLKYRPRRPQTSGDLRALRRIHERHLGVGVLPVGAPRSARLVSQDALVRVHRARLGGDRHLRPRAQLQSGLRTDLHRRGRGRHLRLHRLRPRLVGDAGSGRRRSAPARHGDRAWATRARTAATPRSDLFAQLAARAGRTFWLNPEPRLYWNYGDSVIAAYEEYCTAFECWTTAQLEDFVRALTRPVSARCSAARGSRPAR